jgi:CheY-like chemotaxis protein/anti-sigma regulatory factor (Ser/Thr protein kinase)
MVRLLVVDDAATERHLAGALLQAHPGWEVVFAADGREALSAVLRATPDLVLTDLQMPALNGLELVEAIQRDYPFLPVILMTAYGSEEIAVAALHKGAASYVPKKNLARDLVRTVENVLNVAKTSPIQPQVLDCLTETEFRFVLDNDAARIKPLVGHLQDQMALMKLVDPSGQIRVGTALHEALVNAMEHGNLELGSELREAGNYEAYREVVDKRRTQPPYRDRRVRVSARFSRAEAVYVIRDEGRGFDATNLPDPTVPANLEKVSGRGLFLIRTFMDEARFNAAGNEITLIKRR